MIEGDEFIAYGFEQFKEEDKSKFKLDQIRVNNQSTINISCLCAGIECLIIATKEGTILRSYYDEDNEFEVIKAQKEEVKGNHVGNMKNNIANVMIEKMFIDVHGYHCILVSAEGEHFYLHYERNYLVPLKKLNKVDITAIAFNVNARKETTDALLIGTQDGKIFTYKIMNKEDGVLEKQPNLVAQLPRRSTIYGLAFDTYQRKIKNTDEIGSTTLVMVFTSDSWYQFTGTLPFVDFFKRSPAEIEKQRRPVPGEEVPNTEVKFFYTRDKYVLAELGSFVWKFGIGVCRGQFRRRGDIDGHVSIKDLVTDAYQMRGMRADEKAEVPEAIGITEFYVFFLYPNSIIAISRITREIEYSDNFRAGERMLQMTYEIATNSMWIYSTKALYRLSVRGVDKDLWKQYLAGSNFKEALRLCEDDKENYSYVAGIYGDSKFKNKEYLEAVSYTHLTLPTNREV
eukprot:TRINITY_DN2897_c0_g2_i1.p1 TRINITY_DN2897_c0_g2~~TRINITY_DN2897_c0_g2_i1.p1  ORF type:complete len:456 (-),score=132.08 TRINITY_DN2897_c0_g2_i1:35-1402(-)